MPRSTRSRCRPLSANSLLVLASLAGSSAAAHAAAPNCVDVQVGSARSYDCINQALKGDVASSRAAPDPSTLDATSPAPRIGLYNQAGTREHLGANFGISAFPARPQTTFPARPQ